MTNSSTKPPIWFWVISIISLIWHILGVNAYLQQAYRTEAFLAMLNTEQLNAVNDMPSWVTAAFAIAVFAGALGSIALLLRKKWARPLFSLALLGVVLQMIHHLLISNYNELFGPPVMPSVAILILLILIWYSKKANIKGWIA
ncbi:MAG: hypothetical protein KJN66_04195 [Bacteroidia bacterium]|nr:hypothetical protein [Bacteroidia bacterium]